MLCLKHKLVVCITDQRLICAVPRTELYSGSGVVGWRQICGTMKQNELEKMQQTVEAVACELGLDLVLLFGSYARGKTHKKSDLDVAVHGSRRLTPYEIAQISFMLSQELKHKNVEIIDLRTAPSLLLRRIAQEGKLLYEREAQLFARFRIYAFKRYMEAQPLLKLREAALDKFVKAEFGEK